MRAPCRNEECWKAPDCLIPTYRRNDVSTNGLSVHDFQVRVWTEKVHTSHLRVSVVSVLSIHHISITYEDPFVSFLHVSSGQVIEDNSWAHFFQLC